MALHQRKAGFLVAGDFALLILSLWLSLTVRNLELPPWGYFFEHFVAFLPVFAASLSIFFIAGLYEKQTRLVRGLMGGRILGAQLASVLLAAVFFFLLPLAIAPKTILALYLGFSVILVSAWRFAAIPRFAARTRETALLIGSGEAVDELYDEVNNNHRYYVQFERLSDAGGTEALVAEVRQAATNGTRLIVLDTRSALARELLPQLYDTMLRGVSFVEFSKFYEDVFDRVPLAHIDHAWLLECLPKTHAGYDLAKRVFDLTLALIGIVLALPFILFGVLGRVLTGTPVFFLHERIGKGGKTFTLVKLSSMRLNDFGNPELQKENRVTRFGLLLRKTRIDELPQLWNVMKGELSFIGPRPELPEIARVYQRDIPYYDVRHLITPGLSGWAQIWDYDAPRGSADVGRTGRKLSYDLYYLKRRSFALDLIIALKTLRALAAFSGK